MKTKLSICAFRDLFRRETVFFLALLAAALLLPFSPPRAEDINFAVLATLFPLMLLTTALSETGFLRYAAVKLARLVRSERGMSLALVMACALFAMLVTNDVALLAMVPFTLTVSKCMNTSPCRTVVLETAAANLGSSLLPFGNPQNLYLFNVYRPAFGEFLSAVLPVTLTGLAVLFVIAYAAAPARRVSVPEGVPAPKERGALIIALPLLALVLMAVLRTVNPYAACAMAALAMLLVMPRAFFKADYFLLATFVLFFWVAGSLSRLPAVNALLGRVMTGDAAVLAAGALTSQVISNVPAAILLSAFTDRFAPLLVGVTIGGLGTPLASLASLISLKLYRKSHPAGRFLLYFGAVNVLLLAALFALSLALL